MINIPFNGAELLMLEPQKVNIQWMPRHYKQAGNITTYDLKVCKVPDGYEPTEALDACVSPVIDDKANPGTFYPGNTGIGNSIIGALERGARYAARVTIHEFDPDGNEVAFANEGRSEVTWFRYGAPCVCPETFAIKEAGPGRVQLTWETQIDNKSYKILYRKSGESNWITQTVSGTTITIPNLSKGTYEFAVQVACTEIMPTNLQAFELEEEDDEQLPPILQNPLLTLVSVSGGGKPITIDSLHTLLDSIKIPCAAQISDYAGCDADMPTVNPTGVATPGTKPLTSLNPGDLLSIYDMTVVVTEVSGGNAFSGKGLARLPFAQNTMVSVEFSGVKAWKAQSEDIKGGCVYQIDGYFKTKNLSPADLAGQQSLVIAALTNSKDTMGFNGTLTDALKAYDSTTTVDDLSKYTAAVLQGSQAIATALDDLVDEYSDPRLIKIRTELDSLIKVLAVNDSLCRATGNITRINNLTSVYTDLFKRLEDLKNEAGQDPADGIYAIRNVEVSNVDDQSARISWVPSGNFAERRPTKYVIEYQDPNGGVLQETVTGSQVNLLRLQEGISYKYKILAYSGDKVVATYGEGMFTTIKRTIPKPENLAYTVLDGNRVKITWDKNSLHKDFKLVFHAENGETGSVYPTENEIILNNITPDQIYNYEVVAYGNERLSSDASTESFNTGKVCSVKIIGPSRIIQDDEVNLTVAGCRAQIGSNKNEPVNGTLSWETPEGIKLGSSITVSPRVTSTYKVTCSFGSISCPDEITIYVDKKCKGVMANMVPENIKSGEPVLLKGSGCLGKYSWSDGYPSASILSNSKSFIAYPQAGNKTYTLSCTDADGSVCLVQTPELVVDCSFKLAVTTHNDEIQDCAFICFRSNTGTIYVEPVGCDGTIVWERIGGKGQWGNKIVESNWGNGGKSYNPVERGFTVNAKCTSSGCTATTGFISRPPVRKEGGCDNYPEKKRITIVSETSNVLKLSLTGAPNYKWDDNESTEEIRSFPMPQTVMTYSASTDNGCKTSLAYAPKKITNETSPIPCKDFIISGPTNVEIPENGSSVKIQLKASGCTNGLENSIISWKRDGVQISSGIQESITITFLDSDKDKTRNFSATCTLTGDVKTHNVKVTKVIPAPLAPQDPCDFYLYTNKGQFYDTFLESNQENVEIFTWGMGTQVQAFLQTDDNKIISVGPNVSYKNGEAIISFFVHNAKKGSISVKVTNWVGGAFCSKSIYINVSNDRSVNPNFVPFEFKGPVTPISGNCEKYRGKTEIPIIRDSYGQSLYILNNSNLRDFGVLSLYVKGQTVFYQDVTVPDKIALVDKVCNANRGSTSYWYADAARTSRLNDFITLGGYTTAIVDDPDFERSKTYFSRCVFRNGDYCDKQVVVNPGMSRYGRIGTTESGSSIVETTLGCQFSKQKAVDILLSDILCQKLSLLKGSEKDVLIALKIILGEQGVELAIITDAMVADMVAGECYKVVEALTANITGTASVSDLNNNLVNEKNVNNIFSQIGDKILVDPIDECTPPPADLDESSFGGGRVAANVIDYNRFFIAPDGRAIKLPPGAEPKFFNFGKRWGAPPKGTLQGFVLASGKKYFADITNSPQRFNGYILVQDPICEEKEIYPESLYQTAPAGSKVYYLEEYKQEGDCGYNWIEANYTFSPSSQGSIKDIVPPLTGSYVNITRFTGCVEETPWTTGIDGIKRKTIIDAGNKFSLEDKNGDITVKGAWKSFPKCPTCGKVAEDALQNALTKARQKNGKITEKTNVVDKIKIPYGLAGNVTYTNMNVSDILKNMAETYNSLLEKARIPVEAWQPNGQFYIRDETAVISGAIDQAIEETTETAQLVGLGLTLVSDPQGAYDQLSSFGNDLMDWEKAQGIGKELVKGAVFADEFGKGGKYALHATGRAGVVIAKTVLTAGAAIVIIKDAPGALRRAVLMKLLRSKLKDPSLETQLEKDIANDAFYKLLDADNGLTESWEVLHNAEKPKLKLAKEALEKVKELLTDAKVQKALGANYADELSAICKAQGFPPHGGYGPKSLVSHLDDLKTFFTKFEGKEDMAEMIKAMKNSNENVQDGLQHALAQLNSLEASSVKKFDVEFDAEGFDCPKTACRLDVEMNGNNPRFYEYKSYQDASQISVNQFTSYLSRVSSLSEMKYIFNAAKLSTEQAKEGMKVFMSNSSNKKQIFDAMQTELKNALEIDELGDLTDLKITELVEMFVESK